MLARFGVYVIAGGCYGLAGVFISAQTGSGDPLVGNPMLLSIFAAVVLGGTRLGGGRGGPIGSMFGAYILMIVVNVLLVLNVSAYYSTIAEGLILMLAVLASSISRDSTLASQIRSALVNLAAWRTGTLPRQIGGGDRRLVVGGLRESGLVSLLGNHLVHAPPQTLRYALPSYVCFLAVVVVTAADARQRRLHWSYWNSLIVLSSFLAILALGQGTVILTGGLDLSVPWMIGFCGILLAGMVQGSDKALIYALPSVFAIACLIGFVNGIGIVALGVSPIVMTLATNGVLQGAALLYSDGTPAGFSSPLLRWFMTGHDRGRHAGRLFPHRLRRRRGDFAVAHAVRPPGLRHRQRRSRRATVRHCRRPNADLGLRAFGALFCSRRRAAHRLFRTGEPRHGRRLSVAVDRCGRGRRHASSPAAAARYLGMLGGVLLLTALQTMLAGTQSSLRDTSNSLRPRRSRGGDRIARAADLIIGATG